METVWKPRDLVDRMIVVAPYGLSAALLGLLVSCVLLRLDTRAGGPLAISVEDGYIEWCTVYVFGWCFVLALTALAATWQARTRPQRIFLILFALLQVLAAGEELSWGVRVFQ